MKARLALTMGDPAGVGPEIVLKALQHSEVIERAYCCVVGSVAAMQRVANDLRLGVKFYSVHESQMRWSEDQNEIQVLEPEGTLASDFAYGTVSAAGGSSSVDFVRRAAELARSGVVDAIVTAPINKEALRAASIAYPGHTELLGSIFSSTVETMFVVDRLRIFFLTRHLSLRDAIDAISQRGLVNLIEHARQVLISLGIEDPILAVAGLNPHAGDGGLFGVEEMDIIQPAIQEAKGHGWDVRGPVGADSVFHQALQGRYDAVIALYHDQGHIAAKTFDFDRTVSVTTGLPIIRTSVDHGTAFDIAGQGIADPTNMIEAIKVAANLADARRVKGNPFDT